MDPQGTDAEQRSRSGFASTLALSLAAVAVASTVAKLLVDGLRGSDECGTILTLIVDVLILIALVSSVLAVIVGVVAVARRSGSHARALAGTAIGVVLGAILLTPVALSTYVCSVGAA